MPEDKDITGLTEVTSPADGDTLYIYSGSADKRVTVANLRGASLFQPSDADLTAIAALTPSNDDVIQRKAGAWTNRTPAQLKTDLSLSGTNTGDQDLSGLQPLDSDLTAIAALSPSNDDVIQRKAGVWTNRTPAQVKTDLALAKADVGLGNVDNTSDSSKPISTATQAALDLKAPLTPSVNAQTGTTYTLVAGDNGKIVTLSNASAITVTVPSGLGAGFNCLCVQLGAGQVTFSPSSTTINHRQSHTKIAGQYGVASLVAYAANVFALAGDTAS